MTDIDHLLHKHTRSADVLKEHLRKIAGDDTDLIRDMIEGETPLRSRPFPKRWQPPARDDKTPDN